MSAAVRVRFNEWTQVCQTGICLGTTNVVGTSHPNRDGSSRQERIAQLGKFGLISLRREPNNPHDPRAISVWSHLGQIGYLPSCEPQNLVQLMDDGCTVLARVDNLFVGKDGLYHCAVDIVVRPRSPMKYVFEVVGITGKDENGTPRKELAEEVRVGDDAYISLDSSASDEEIVRVSIGLADIGKLKKADAKKIAPLIGWNEARGYVTKCNGGIEIAVDISK